MRVEGIAPHLTSPIGERRETAVLSLGRERRTGLPLTLVISP
jgi:hypothetical protein